MNTTLLKHPLPSTVDSAPPGRRTAPRSSQPLPRPLAWLRDRVASLKRQRTPALQLEFADRFVCFCGLEEFEFSLRSRTEFPAARVKDLIKLDPSELERTATTIRGIERRFSSVLARSVREPGLIGEFIRELDLKTVSQDHDWREIMESLVRLSPEFDAYKRVALVKYMQYLRARQSIMRSVFVEKTLDDQDACLHATRAHEDAMVLAGGDTAIFDVSPIARRPREDDEFTSLPKGESIRIDLTGVRDMELLLAGNRMRLYTGRDWYLTDEGSHTYPLGTGKNLVGRHSTCDVIVDSACRSVSRHHLIVEPTGDGAVVLTDLSSHGTEIPAALLRSTH